MLSTAARITQRHALTRSVRRLCVVTAGNDVAASVAQDKCTVLYFTAAWCGPCRMISPIYADLAKQNAGANFVKVDVDDLPEVAQVCKCCVAPEALCAPFPNPRPAPGHSPFMTAGTQCDRYADVPVLQGGQVPGDHRWR
jgi:thiol-disulfide isomerase/thioredoxin